MAGKALLVGGLGELVPEVWVSCCYTKVTSGERVVFFLGMGVLFLWHAGGAEVDLFEDFFLEFFGCFFAFGDGSENELSPFVDLHGFESNSIQFIGLK